MPSKGGQTRAGGVPGTMTGDAEAFDISTPRSKDAICIFESHSSVYACSLREFITWRRSSNALYGKNRCLRLARRRRSGRSSLTQERREHGCTTGLPGLTKFCTSRTPLQFRSWQIGVFLGATPQYAAKETEDFFFEDCSSQQGRSCVCRTSSVATSGWKKYTSDLGHWWTESQAQCPCVGCWDF